MHLTLTEEQYLIQDMARKFAVAELEPIAAQLDRDKDRIEDSLQANIDDGEEREQVLARYEEAEAALAASP